MTKGQVVVIISAVLLWGVLYFGCETKTRKQQTLNESRAITAQNTSIENLRAQAEKSLDEVERSELSLIEQELQKSTNDSLKVSYLKQLSGKWYDFGFPSIAGHYAEEIAKIENQGEAWSIAGTTYVICLQKAASAEKEKEFCMNRAVHAFENAISLDPQNLTNKVNLALAYVENPPQSNPMKGILQLRELNEANPKNTLVLSHLARLAIRTGQNERAIQRLTNVLEIDPNNTNAFCLLAQAYDNIGNAEQAALYSQKCSGK